MTPQLKQQMQRPTHRFNNVQFPFVNINTGHEILATDWQQHWTCLSTTTVGDQYGFTITHDSTEEKPFHLQHKGTTVARVFTLHTAKMISCILMNDILNHKPAPNEAD